MFGNLSERRKHYKFKRNITAVLCALFILSIPAYAAFVVCVLGFDLNPSLIVIALMLPLALFVALAVNFAKYTNLYPLNILPSDLYKRIKAQYLKGKSVQLHIRRREGGIWSIDDKIYFDIRGYAFPKIYICSYFVRNVNYSTVNDKTYAFSSVGKSLPTDEFENFQIVFEYGGATKTMSVVKNGVTKAFPLQGFLISCRFYADWLNRYEKSSSRRRHVGENDYENLRR